MQVLDAQVLEARARGANDFGGTGTSRLPHSRRGPALRWDGGAFLSWGLHCGLMFLMLIVGLIVFVGIHLLPYFSARDTVAARLGPNVYRGGFSFISVVGLALICFGYSRVPVEYLFVPIPWLRSVLIMVMPVVLVLFAAANMPTRIRKLTRHPMMIGTLLWATLHFLANGERAACYLFGAFAIFAVISIVASSLRSQTREPPPPGPHPGATRALAWKFDAMAIFGGIAAYAVIASLHGWLFGVPVI